MFTGIIQAVGRIHAQTDLGAGDVRLQIATATLDMSDVQLGDSIAVNGVCLTVVEQDSTSFVVVVSQETLRCTIGLNCVDAEVNLEKALRLADRLGGHLVSGHVDGVGEISRWDSVGDCIEMWIQLPEALACYTADKGSICVNGVSLTTNRAWDNTVSINLIPHTLTQTNLHSITVGSLVNIEVDQIARYVARLMPHWLSKQQG